MLIFLHVTFSLLVQVESLGWNCVPVGQFAFLTYFFPYLFCSNSTQYMRGGHSESQRACICFPPLLF